MQMGNQTIIFRFWRENRIHSLDDGPLEIDKQ